jgi:superoxide dismutase, Cu-Zn family
VTPKCSPILVVFWILPMAVFAQQETPPVKPVIVDIKNAAGQSVGTSTFSEAQPLGVELVLKIWDLAPGRHAFDIHQKGQCGAKEDFGTAGLQYDPTGEYYGKADHRAHSGPAAGDPRALLGVAANGTGHTTIVFPGLTQGNDSRSVFANGGTAMVFHAVSGAQGQLELHAELLGGRNNDWKMADCWILCGDCNGG